VADAWAMMLHGVKAKEAFEAIKSIACEAKDRPPTPGQVLARTSAGQKEKEARVVKEMYEKDGKFWLRTTKFYPDKREPEVRDFFEGSRDFQKVYRAEMEKIGCMRVVMMTAAGRAYVWRSKDALPITGYETENGQQYPTESFEIGQKLVSRQGRGKRCATGQSFNFMPLLGNPWRFAPFLKSRFRCPEH